MTVSLLPALAFAVLIAMTFFSTANATSCSSPPRQFFEPMQFYTEEGQHGTNIAAVGAIKGGEARRLARLIDRVGAVNEIKLASPGGVMIEGMEIGRVIRARKLATKVPRGWRCVSACTHAFLGGVLRKVEPGGCYEVHMASMSSVLNRKVDQYFQAFQKRNMTRQQYNSLVKKMIQDIEQLAAGAAEIQANYFIEMSVSLNILDRISKTPYATTHTMSQNELRLYNVNNY